jgi:anthranilate phosphoribosyltransferase
MIGAAKALRAADAPFPRPDYLFADTCGTGGDGSSLINVSTAVAFVAAAAGLPIAKHGNRSVTSPCGSADVLEQLGVRLDVSAEVSRRALDEAGVCFLLAPLYHPGLRHAAPVRRALKVRTIMNLLGPLPEPGRAPGADPGRCRSAAAEPVARTLASLGVRNALVVHGSGIDEMALHGETRAMRVSEDRFETLTITPEDAGLERRPLEKLKGGGPEENAARMKALLIGKGQPAEVDSVALNAGALLSAAGLAPGLREGVAHARDVIASGAAYRRLRCSSRRPMTDPGGVLGEIVARKRVDVTARLAGVTLEALRARAAPTERSLAAALARPGARFIMEVKRASPSEGTLRQAVDPAAIARAYRGAADAISVLVDTPYFGGSYQDLRAVRAEFAGPILAKDFVVDVRQVPEGRAHGADAVLVMLSVLDDGAAAEIMAEARRLGMEALVEAHDAAEVRRAVALGAKLIGINNRDLRRSK